MAHGELYASEFGWDTTFEGLVAEIVARFAAGDFVGPAAAWIAERDGERLGCVLCVAGDETGVAVLRTLLVDPRARGQSLGSRLVDTALRFAREAGYARARLWTNDCLDAARRIYLRHGFALVEESAHHSFGVDLVGQVYERPL